MSLRQALTWSLMAEVSDKRPICRETASVWWMM